MLADYYTENDGEGAYFGILGACGVVLGLLLLALTPKVRALMHGVH